MANPTGKVQRRPVRESAKTGRITRQAARKAVKKVLNRKAS